ncbi:hypothetical protein C2E23DRAFT_848783 [Lenzites betulinus]|nr:hypothetical protein C2E23DRAFT_848783 [Lenzites betulinus]
MAAPNLARGCVHRAGGRTSTQPLHIFPARMLVPPNICLSVRTAGIAPQKRSCRGPIRGGSCGAPSLRRRACARRHV